MPDEPNYDDVISAALPTSAPKVLKVARGGEKLKGVQPDLINHWNNLQTEFSKAGITPSIKSGYRTAKNQQDLYNNPATRALTKGNDGIINISPHQEGRALDISFSAAQKPKGRQIIADYAKRNGLHVPSDEPWHIAIPKAQQGDNYDDVIKAALPQEARSDDSYDDVVAAATPTAHTRFGTTRAPIKPNRGVGHQQLEAQSAVADNVAKVAQDALGQVSRVNSRGLARTAVHGLDPWANARAGIEGRQSGVNPAVPVVNADSGIGALRMRDDKEVARRERIGSQMTREQAANKTGLPGLPAYNMGNMSQVEREGAITERARIERQQEAEQAARAAQYQKDKPEIDRLAKKYRTAIKASSVKLGDPNKWTAEMLGNAVAPLLGDLASIGRVSGAPGTELSADVVRLHAEALQQAVEAEGADRNKASKVVQHVMSGFIGSAPELALMSAGVPAPVVFGAGAGARAYGMKKPVVPATVQGVGTGLAFELPGVGKGVTKAVTEGLSTGLGTAGIDLASGATPQRALEGGLTNAFMRGVPGVKEAIGGRDVRTETLPVEPASESVETSPHHSEFQSRRSRNTEHGQKGQFKSGRIERPAETTVPETPETLAAQVDALKNGTRDAVLITQGEKRPAIPPRTSTVKTDAGLWYYNPAKTDANTIRTKVADGTHGDLLGHVSEKPALGEPTATVAATNPDGVEVQSSAVPPEKVNEQVAATQAQNPDAQVEVGGNELAAKVIEARQAQPAKLELDQPVESARLNEISRTPTEKGATNETPVENQLGAESTDSSVRGRGDMAAPSTTSLKKASLAADREALGLSEFSPAEQIGWQKSLDTAKGKLDGDHADRVADAILDGKKKVVDVDESAGLLLRIREIQNRHQEVTEQAWTETDPEKLAELRDEAQSLKEQYNKLSDASKQSKSAIARSLAFNRGAIDQDYSLVGMERQFKVDTGKEATGKTKKQIEDLHKEITRLTEAQKTVDEENAKLRAEAAVKRIKRDVARDTQRAARGQKKASLDDEAVQIRDLIAQAWKKNRQQTGVQPSVFARLDPEGEITKLVLKLAKNRVQKGTVTAEGLVTEVHGLLKDVVDDLSTRDVREMLSGYGRAPTKRSALQKQLDSLKSELYQGLSQEDIAAGRRSAKGEGPRLSGAPKQGPKLTDAPKVGPRDSWPTRQRAIEKQIAELERKIQAEDFSGKTKTGKTVLTPEAQKLADRLEAKQNEYQNLKRRNEPWNWLRNLSGIRKAGMLSGYITHIRNTLGTGGYIGFDEARRVPSVIADAAISTLTGRRTTTLSPSAMLDGVIQAVKVGGREAGEIMKSGATREDMARHQYQEINTGSKAINNAFNFVFRVMSASDRVFYQGSYKRNLVERAQAQAKTEARTDRSINWRERAKEMIDNPTPELEADAKHDALVATFNNDNRLSNMVKSARGRAGAGGNFALDMVLPFDRTPTNVIARVIEASPAGYAKNAGQLAKALWKKSFTPAEQRAFVETFGRATTGTALIALGAGLAAKGLLETDDYGTTYLKVRGRKINLSAVAPLGTLLGVGAGIRKQWEKGDASKRNYAGAVTKPLSDQPLLKSSSQISDFLQDPNRSAGKLGAGLAASFIPFSGAVRTAGEAFDPADKRYPDSSFKEQFQRNIPEWRESLPASRVRLLGSEVTKATKEAERLGITIHAASRQEDESPEDFKARQALENGMIRTQIENVVKLPDYDKASDADKTEWLKQAAKYARGQAKEQIPEKPEKPEKREFPMPSSGFDRAFPDQALKRYEKLSPAKRSTVYNAMAEKAWLLLNSPTLSDEEKAKYKKRLDAVGITPRAPNTPVPSLGSTYKAGVPR